MSKVTGLLSGSAWVTVTTLSVVALTDIIPILNRKRWLVSWAERPKGGSEMPTLVGLPELTSSTGVRSPTPLSAPLRFGKVAPWVVGK